MAERPEVTRGALLDEARAALRDGEWQLARDRFTSALEGDGDCPEAWEGLGSACYWLQDPDPMFDARQRAYRGYRSRDDLRSAARVATWLASDYLEFRGEAAVAGGWLERSEQLLADLAPSPEHVWLRAMKAHVALAVHRDPPAALAAAGEARDIARGLNDLDGEILARALEGLARVAGGDVEEGMRRLDGAAAAAFGGELTDLNCISVTCCCVIQACERVRDFGRATEWCRRFEELCSRWGLGSFLTFCRIQLGTVLICRGAWAEAEEELLAALHDLERVRPSARGAALARLGELRRRQGRWDEAAAHFDEAGAHRLALLWGAALALDQGDVESAEEGASRAIRRAPRDRDAWRVTALEVLVRARAARGALEEADSALSELEGVAAELGTPPVRGSAHLAGGVLASTRDDPETARCLLEDAADLFAAAGCPFESAGARVELARVLRGAGRDEAARREARTALDLYERLGAVGWAERARKLCEGPDATVRDGGDSPPPDSPLTPRQIEVLRLVARGLTNRQIGKRLSLSEHTIRRHLSNAYRRLRVSSRSAAVARGLRDGFL